jgi:protein SCO1/2
MSTDKKKRNQRIFLIAIFFVGFAFIFVLSRMDHAFSTLPYYFPADVQVTEVDGVQTIDTIWDIIPEFQFTDHHGNAISDEDMLGHVTVVNFFFTTCRTICPKMTRQMNALVFNLEEKYFDDIRFMSYTVDPEYDTPEVLAKYAKQQEAIDERWFFITGDKSEIYDLGVNGFRVTTQEDVNEQGNFLHSEKMILVDAKGHIRGFYDGTSPDEVRVLEEDIKILIGTERKRLKREGK